MTNTDKTVTRPIIGIENRTAQEVFDIMCDRFRASRTQEPAEWQVEAAAEVLRNYGMEHGNITAARFALRAASITPPAPERSKEEVGVKPLEWEKHPTAEMYRAMTMLGSYQAIAMRKTGWMYDGFSGEEASEEGLSSIDEAKAAAQADYEQRILSAIEPASLHKGEVKPDPTYRSPREDAAYFGSIWSLSTNQMAELEKTFEYHRDHHLSFGADYPGGAPSSERASCTDPLADREKSAASPSPPPVTITQDMVERACSTWWGSSWATFGDARPRNRAKMSAALTAALSKPGEQG